MLGLIKFLAYIATAMILNHQATAHQCHPSIDYRCEGTIFRLQITRPGSDEGDHLVGKSLTTTYLQANNKRLIFSAAQKNKTVCHADVDDAHDDDKCEKLFKNNNTLVYLSPCDDFSQGYLPEWFQLCVCHKLEGVHCIKERLVFKKGY